MMKFGWHSSRTAMHSSSRHRLSKKQDGGKSQIIFRFGMAETDTTKMLSKRSIHKPPDSAFQICWLPLGRDWHDQAVKLDRRDPNRQSPDLARGRNNLLVAGCGHFVFWFAVAAPAGNRTAMRPTQGKEIMHSKLQKETQQWYNIWWWAVKNIISFYIFFAINSWLWNFWQRRKATGVPSRLC
jgi:hypothetical protein